MASTSKSMTGARTTVRLPEDLHHRAKMASAWSGTKLQDFVSAAVERHLTDAEAAMERESPRAKKHR
jgi:predicted HicB family RNase H-like nuclease